MKKAKLILKGMLALALVLPFIMAACDTGYSTKYVDIDVPVGGGGDQLITVTPTEKPEVEAIPYKDMGFKISWAPVIETAHYEVWRDAGGPDGSIFVGEGGEQQASPYNTGPIKFEKGYYVMYDIADLDFNGEPTLVSGTNYSYTVVAIPYVGVRDSGKNEVPARVSGTIVPKGTPVANVTANLIIDGLKRNFVFEFDADGFEFLAGDFTWELYELDAQGKKATVLTTGNTIDQSAGIVYNDSGAITGGKKTKTWPTTGSFTQTQWKAFGNDGKKEITYVVEIDFTYSGAVNRYFSEIKEMKIQRKYKNLFDWDTHAAQAIVSTAQTQTDYSIDFRNVVSWAKPATPTSLTQGIIYDNSGTNNWDAAADPKIVNFSTDIDVSAIKGFENVEYRIERAAKETSALTWGAWETVDDLFRRVVVPAAQYAPNSVGGYEWVDVKGRAALTAPVLPAVPAIGFAADRYGNMNIKTVYDRKIPVSAMGKQITYRIIGKTTIDGVTVEDYVAQITVPHVGGLNAPLDGQPVATTIASLIKLQTVAAANDAKGRTDYTLTPVWTKSAGVDNDADTVSDPDSFETVNGLLSDTDKIYFKWVRGQRGNMAIWSGYTNEDMIEFGVNDILLKKALPFDIETKVGLGRLSPINLDVFARAYIGSDTTARQIALNGGTSTGIKTGSANPNIVVQAKNFNNASVPVGTNPVADGHGVNHYLLVYPFYSTAANSVVLVSAEQNNGVKGTTASDEIILTFLNAIDGTALAVNTPIDPATHISVSGGGGVSGATDSTGVVTCDFVAPSSAAAGSERFISITMINHPNVTGPVVIRDIPVYTRKKISLVGIKQDGGTYLTPGPGAKSTGIEIEWDGAVVAGAVDITIDGPGVVSGPVDDVSSAGTTTTVSFTATSGTAGTPNVATVVFASDFYDEVTEWNLWDGADAGTPTDYEWASDPGVTFNTAGAGGAIEVFEDN